MSTQAMNLEGNHSISRFFEDILKTALQFPNHHKLLSECNYKNVEDLSWE